MESLKLGDKVRVIFSRWGEVNPYCLGFKNGSQKGVIDTKDGELIIRFSPKRWAFLEAIKKDFEVVKGR